MARRAFAWGEFGEKLSVASQRIGISTGRLQSLQGGARLAGASAEAMTSGLRTLGDTLTDAVAGRAPEAVVIMNTLGIAWRDANGHARSVPDVLPELADRIAAIKNPALQARVATALLGAAGEQLLPYLRRGRQGMADYAEEARHYGVINERAAEVAEEFERQQHALGLARAQGRHGGRRPKFTQAQRAEVLTMLAASRPAAEVARLFQVHRATISRLNATSRQTEAV